MADVLIRQPEPHEHSSVQALIKSVADETFGDLFAPSTVSLKLEEEYWSLAWVAVSGDKIVGVVLTREEWISDLWVLREHRREGIGQRLLSQGELEIARRGHRMFRLRVVKPNLVAVQFYLREGWQVAREFPHEKFRHEMLEMNKSSQRIDDSDIPFVIRRYRTADRDAVWTLHDAALKAVGARAKNPGANSLDADLDDIDGIYLNKGGEFLVGLIGNRIVAMGALKRLSSSVAEITRMRVHPQYWRRGYGEAILRRLEDAAIDLGFTQLWLDTVPIQIAAQNLYRKNGFREVLRMYVRDYDAHEAILFQKTR